MRSLFAPPLLISLMASAMAQTGFDPTLWNESPLEVATGNTNHWYLFPDSTKKPRVLVKMSGTANNVTHRILTGGPPTWTSGAASTGAQMNKNGVLVPFPGGGAYLVAPHNNNLRLIFFNAAGAIPRPVEIIDNSGTVSSIGLNASLDTGGNLHIVYVGNAGATNETLRYACWTSGGVLFKATPQDLSTVTSPVLRETLVLGASSTSATIYGSLKTGQVTSLLRVGVSRLNNVTYLSSVANLGNNIAEPITGNRLGGVDRVYYFLKAGSVDGFWNLRQIGSDDPVQTIGRAAPTSIVCQAGPDNRQRIAWLDGFGKKIHYLKPSATPTVSPFDVLHPVTETEGTSQVLGLHFDEAKTPYLLYKNSGTEAYMAYPDNNSIPDTDANGNGRSDLIDFAFNSTTAGIEVLPTSSTVAGFPMSENKFKFRIPTVGSVISNGAGGLFSDMFRITYSVETSTDALVWTPLGAGSPMFFLPYTPPGPVPAGVKYFTGLYNEAIPPHPARRFFRIKVTRTITPNSF